MSVIGHFIVGSSGPGITRNARERAGRPAGRRQIFSVPTGRVLHRQKRERPRSAPSDTKSFFGANRPKLSQDLKKGSLILIAKGASKSRVGRIRERPKAAPASKLRNKMLD